MFGRVDFAGSLGHDRSFVNSEEMAGYVNKVAEVAAARGLELVVGGGVAPTSIPLLSGARDRRLDRFETRKVVFDAAVVKDGRAEAGMDLAIEFELLWLQNKRDFYRGIAMMEARAATLKASATA